MAKRRPDDKAPTEDDLQLWARVARTAKPLKKPLKRNVTLSSSAPERSSKPVSPPTHTVLPPVASERRAPKALPELAYGSAPGLDKSTAEKLRRGGLPIEGRLDLHGHTQEEAHRALIAFVEYAWRARRRSLIVITGKGGMGRNAGVLRTMVPRWLNTEPLRPRVLAFASAQPKDGGAGALYVLLKRQR